MSVAHAGDAVGVLRRLRTMLPTFVSPATVTQPALTLAHVQHIADRPALLPTGDRPRGATPAFAASPPMRPVRPVRAQFIDT